MDKKANFFIETFQRKQNSGYRREILNTFNITNQIKNEDFDIRNASKVLKMQLSWNDAMQLKKELSYTDMIRIRAEDIILLFKDDF